MKHYVNAIHIYKKTKKINYLRTKLSIIIFYYNFIKSHSTLSKKPDKTYTPKIPSQVADTTYKLWTFQYLCETPLILTG